MKNKKVLTVIFIFFLISIVTAFVLLSGQVDKDINNYYFENIKKRTNNNNDSYQDIPDKKQSYNGYIKADMPINIKDLNESLEITGSINQTLNVGYHESVFIDEDFNFDGFNDLKILTNAGSGYSALYDYDIYLYNFQTKLFESFDKLKGVVNISVDTENKRIIQTFKYFSNENNDELITEKKEYDWQDVLDGKLENSRG